MFSEPAVGERFFGRDEVLDLLNKRVLALKDGYRQNVALTGQSLAGKTSILQHFLHGLRDEPFITVYVEVIKEPFRSFANKFIATLLYNSIAKTGERVSVDLDSLIEKSQKVLPRTYAAIKNVNSFIEREDLDDAYSSLLALTSAVKDDLKISCIVILDEFDNLEDVGIKNPFLSFGKVIMVQKDTMYIVSSSRNEAIRRILSEKLSLLFGNFEIVRIPGFDLKTSSRFIEVKMSGFDIADEMKRFLIGFTGGNPFYLDKILARIKLIAQERMSNSISEGVVCRAILDLVYDSSGTIHQYIFNYLLDIFDTRYRENSISMLVSIANGMNRIPDIAKALRIKQGDASKELSRLIELGILSKNGVFYKIEDVVIEFWIKNVYQARRELLVDGVIDKMAIFNENLRALISASVIDAGIDMASKIADLFRTFSNELIQVDSRALRVPHFTRVDVRQLNAAAQTIIASFRGRSWVVQVYQDEVNENDVIDYVKGLKALPIKVSNKLIIPLKGIDEMAKLLAKELKISIWDISVVNTLLTSYGKRRITVL